MKFHLLARVARKAFFNYVLAILRFKPNEIVSQDIIE